MSLQNELAEKAIVGRLLLNPQQIPLVAGTLRSEDFAIGQYREMYRAMTKLSNEGIPVDVLTLRAEMDEDYQVDPLEFATGHHGSLEHYAELVIGAANRRRIVTELEHVQSVAQSGEGDPMVALEQAVATILSKRERGDVIAPEDASKGYLDVLMNRQAGRDTGVTFGIPGMDDHLIPARPGRVVLLAARPSVGKTAMAETIADHWARSGHGPVLFVSLEMDKDELWDRAMARDTGVSAEAIAKGVLTQADLEKVAEAAALRSNLPIHYLDKGETTTASIKAEATRIRMQNEGKLAGIIIDYTQLLNDRGDGGNDNSRVAAISRAIKQLAKSMRCPVLAMSQLNRNLEYNRRDPRLSDLRDSGALEQDADVVMIMTGKPDVPMRKVYILKQRQGRVAQFHIRFDGDHMTWHEPGPWQPFEAPAPEEEKEDAEAALTW